jgi:hypothetical protein
VFEGWSSGAYSSSIACWPGIAVPPGSAHYPDHQTHGMCTENAVASESFYNLKETKFGLYTSGETSPQISNTSLFKASFPKDSSLYESDLTPCPKWLTLINKTSKKTLKKKRKGLCL